jgi:hypothetical protein
MKIVARREGEPIYLVQTREEKGRIVDLDQGKMFPEGNLDGLLMRGYWVPFVGDEDKILEQIQGLS